MSYTRPMFRAIASKLDAMRNCEKTKNDEWKHKHKEAIFNLVANRFPSGSGFDGGTSFDFNKSKPDRLIFSTAFHHMDANGFYDGWTNHDVIITPSLVFGYEMRITGRDRNEIKDYIADAFRQALDDETDE